MKLKLSAVISACKITNFSGWKTGLLPISFYFLIFTCLPQGSIAQETFPRKFKLPDVLNEVSGLFIQAPDSLWWHNDSGNPPTLYRTNRQGDIVEEIHFDFLRNRDWEDISHDSSGNIYIGDFGNNCNCRKDLRVYIYHPELQTVDSILFHFEDQTDFPPGDSLRNFDLEAFFWHNDSLHLFSKNTLRKGGDFTCKHYVIPASPGTHTARITETITLPGRVATGAAISADGNKVAIVSYRFKMLLGFLPFSQASVFVFSDFEGSRFFSGKMEKYRIPPFFIATQYESIDFIDSKTVYVASERTVIIRPKAKKVKIAR
ncbi:MAG: hypothetical protein GYB31_04420 [Bacteroidetes bacterium]|nr:hypothetical protein [Bacteroidota bacterium]